MDRRDSTGVPGVEKRRAIFLDRDGTLVHPRHYPRRPEDLVLYDSIVVPMRALQELDFVFVIVTNQSGVARGYLTEEDLERMHAHLRESLARRGVRVQDVYFCPHHPDGVVPHLAIACDCRKPAPGMVVRAALDHNLHLSRSWLVGDILDDVEAGKRAGCRTVLVDLGTEAAPTHPLRQPDFVARDTAHALEIILAQDRGGEPVDLSYRPLSWRRPVTIGEMSHAGR